MSKRHKDYPNGAFPPGGFGGFPGGFGGFPGGSFSGGGSPGGVFPGAQAPTGGLLGGASGNGSPMGGLQQLLGNMNIGQIASLLSNLNLNLDMNKLNSLISSLGISNMTGNQLSNLMKGGNGAGAELLKRLQGLVGNDELMNALRSIRTQFEKNPDEEETSNSDATGSSPLSLNQITENLKSVLGSIGNTQLLDQLETLMEGNKKKEENKKED